MVITLGRVYDYSSIDKELAKEKLKITLNITAFFKVIKKIGLKSVPRRCVQEGRPKVSSFQSQGNPQVRLILDSGLVWETAE